FAEIARELPRGVNVTREPRPHRLIAEAGQHLRQPPPYVAEPVAVGDAQAFEVYARRRAGDASPGRGRKTIGRDDRRLSREPVSFRRSSGRLAALGLADDVVDLLHETGEVDASDGLSHTLAEQDADEANGHGDHEIDVVGYGVVSSPRQGEQILELVTQKIDVAESDDPRVSFERVQLALHASRDLVVAAGLGQREPAVFEPLQSLQRYGSEAREKFGRQRGRRRRHSITTRLQSG